jgi:hypothetical protein
MTSLENLSRQLQIIQWPLKLILQMLLLFITKEFPLIGWENTMMLLPISLRLLELSTTKLISITIEDLLSERKKILRRQFLTTQLPSKLTPNILK